MTDFNLVPGQGLPTDSIERIEGKTVRDSRSGPGIVRLRSLGRTTWEMFSWPRPVRRPTSAMDRRQLSLWLREAKRVTFHEPALKWDDLCRPPRGEGNRRGSGGTSRGNAAPPRRP